MPSHRTISNHIAVFIVDDETGVIVYSAHENGELHKYYATVMAYQSKKSLPKEQIDLMQIHDSFLVTLGQTRR